VRHCGRSLPGRAWALCLVAAMSAALVGPTYAQGPEPAPTGAKPRPVGPEPAPTSRSKATSSSSQSTKPPAATVRPPTVRAPIVVDPPAAIAPQPPVTPQVQQASAQRARVKAPKRPAAAKTQRAQARAKGPVAKLTLGAGHRPGTSVDASPDGKLLAGGLALFVLLLGETIFLALSVRFLAVSRRT
jgi:cytoskeletal protein RodZ